LISSIILNAQTKTKKSPGKKKQTAFSTGRLFKEDSVLQFRLVGKLNTLFSDRDKNIITHPILLQYKEKDSTKSIGLMVRTRGYFRRDKNVCKMPPLMLNFKKENKLKNTV